jgi:hypothetical protein
MYPLNPKRSDMSPARARTPRCRTENYVLSGKAGRIRTWSEYDEYHAGVALDANRETAMTHPRSHRTALTRRIILLSSATDQLSVR